MDVDESLRIFVTGGAGSGKTFVFKWLGHEALGKSLNVTAPTGVAAKIIEGSTRHFCAAYRKGQNRSFILT